MERRKVSLIGLFLSFFKIGAFTFGGGWAMIPLIRRELVQEKKWMEDGEFVDLLALAQSAPGPIAINTAVITGYKIKGPIGSVFCALGSALPSFIIIILVAMFLVDIRGTDAVTAVFQGVRPVIFGLLIAAVWQIGSASIKTSKDILFTIVGAVLLLFFELNPIWVVLLAGLAGAIVGVITRNRKSDALQMDERQETEGDHK
jgi:chromate transporter